MMFLSPPIKSPIPVYFHDFSDIPTSDVPISPPGNPMCREHLLEIGDVGGISATNFQQMFPTFFRLNPAAPAAIRSWPSPRSRGAAGPAAPPPGAVVYPRILFGFQPRWCRISSIHGSMLMVSPHEWNWICRYWLSKVSMLSKGSWIFLLDIVGH